MTHQQQFEQVQQWEQEQDDGIDRRQWICPYCSKVWESEAEGTDIVCCGERARAVVMNGPDDPWADERQRNERLSSNQRDPV